MDMVDQASLVVGETVDMEEMGARLEALTEVQEDKALPVRPTGDVGETVVTEENVRLERVEKETVAESHLEENLRTVNVMKKENKMYIFPYALFCALCFCFCTKSKDGKHGANGKDSTATTTATDGEDGEPGLNGGNGGHGGNGKGYDADADKSRKDSAPEKEEEKEGI